MTVPLTLLATILNNDALVQQAQQLPNIGVVRKNDTYAYLKIADAYVHELYDLIGVASTQKVDYFSPAKPVGAHITITYNEEGVSLPVADLAQEHAFTISNFSHVILGDKEYYVLMIAAPSLEQLRVKHGLDKKPRYKGVPIDFHITIACNKLRPDQL